MSRDPLAALRRWGAANRDTAALPWLLLLVVAAMTLLTGGTFLSGPNLLALSAQLPELGLLSLAMMIAMLTAGINLSIISTANFAGVVMALLLTRLTPFPLGDPLLVGLAIAAGLLFSALLGAVNGVLVAYVGIPSVLATLGTMIFYEGLTIAITKGFVISGFTPVLLAIGGGRVLGVPVPLLVFAGTAAVLSVVLLRRPFGRRVYMTGAGEVATRYSAVNTRRVLLQVYTLSGLLCGVAAVVMLARFNSANARQGSSLQLLTVLIAVLGGTDPDGGAGKVSGLVLALLILQFLSSGFNLLGVSSFLTLALWGAMLVIVIAYRTFTTKN